MSTSPRLSDNKEYPTFLRVVAPDNTINPGIIKLMQHYGWEHIAVITQEEDIFTFVSFADYVLDILAERHYFVGFIYLHFMSIGTYVHLMSCVYNNNFIP